MESNDEETQVNDESMEIENKLKICILHDGENEGNIKSFDESKWKKVRSAIIKRKQWQKKT